jgi:predicted phage terminase large subunit-like protein
MEHIKNRLDWKGAQIPLIGFDQLEDFEEEMFWYMQSRNRSTCGVPPYVRATVNPDPDSFVAGLISWWIDQATGYPIPERSGVIRWFVRMNGQLHWADTRQEIMDEFVVRQGMPEIDVQPISLTFIPAKLSDNAILCVADPSYRAKLLAMPPIDRARLLDANWKVKDTGLIRREWFPIVEGNTVPRDALRLRWSDLAATADGGDYTSSIRLSTKDGIYYIEHCAAGQWGTHERDQRLLEAADLDCALYGNTVEQCIAQDPAAAGKAQVAAFVRAMAKYATYSASESGDKRVRSAPWRSQAEAGNFRMVRGPWNEALILRLLAFPTMDDDVDAISGGYNRLAGGVRLEWWKDLAGERRKRLANAASVAA